MIPYDALVLHDRLFTPFELNEDVSLPLVESDLDVQLYNSQYNSIIRSCDYYMEDTFNKKLSNLNIPPRCLSLIHTNIRSAATNLKKFELYINRSYIRR